MDQLSQQARLTFHEMVNFFPMNFESKKSTIFKKKIIQKLTKLLQNTNFKNFVAFSFGES